MISPIQTSFILHALLVAIGSAVHFEVWKVKKREVIDLTVYTDPVLAQVSQPIENKPVENPPAPPKIEPRKVFGVTRKALTSGLTGISVKAGNTVAKEQDNLELNKDDADSLPIPVADYLITEEPRVISEPQNKQRTDEARKNGYTATAKLKILIDTNGNVRDVKLLNELKHGLGERAIELARQVKLSPAKVDGKAVNALRDFTITFKATD